MAKGDVLQVNLPRKQSADESTSAEIVGREQAGTRPSLAVHIDNPANPLLVVIPGTTNLDLVRYAHTVRVEPTKGNGLSEPTLFLVFQIRAISPNRVIRKLGELETVSLDQINRAMRELLGI